MAVKKYTRKGLIRYFEKLPPRSKPCPLHVCPIMAFSDGRFSGFDDCQLAMRFDHACNIRPIGKRGWHNLTAARIVKIAKAAPHV